MGFWKSFFGGEETNPEEEKKNADAKNFDLMKYDGVKAMKVGQFEYAVKCFEEALKIQEDAETIDYLSRALVRVGEFDEALAQLQRLHELAPENVGVLLQACHINYMIERYDQMKTVAEQAQAVDADNAQVYYMYAQACIGLEDLISAIAHLTKAIALDESLGDARLLRAQTLLKMGDVKGAREDVDWLLEHTEDNEDVLLMAARVATAEGDAEKALSVYNQIVELNPFQLDAYRERGKLRLDQGDKKGAEEDMQKVLELNPNELADVSGDYSAEGVEQAMKRVYSAINPFGL